MIRAIGAVASGEAIFGAGVARRAMAYLRNPRTETAPFAELTPREREVLELIVTGIGNAAIAARLGLAPHTVSNHISSIFALLLATCVVVRGRGRGAANVALVTGLLGTMMYAVSAAVPLQLLALHGQDVIPAGQAQVPARLHRASRHIQSGVAFPGFLLLLIAQIAIAVALFRAKVLPIWVPILFLVGMVPARGRPPPP